MIKCTDEKKQLFFVQIKVKDPITGKWKTKKKRGIQGKRNAQAEERRMMEDASLTTSSDSFRHVWDLWEDNCQASPETRRHHREHFEYRFSEYLDSPIERITRANLIGWRNDLGKTDNSTATKNTTIQYVRSVFRFAADTYGIPNPSVVLKRFRPTDEEVLAEMSVWTPEEFDEFRKCVENRLYLIYFDTLYWTGMRRGEGIALQKSDFTDGWLNIHASQRTASEGLKPTKTRQRRFIRIDSSLNEELKPLLNEPGEYLFGGESPLSPTMIDHYFKKAIKESGVKRIRLHDLRHSHATLLINKGVNIVAVSRRLGHATIEQTLKTYTHLLRDTEDDLISMIEQEKTKK